MRQMHAGSERAQLSAKAKLTVKKMRKPEKYDIFNPRPLPTVEEILRMYEYDRENGLLRYKTRQEFVNGKPYMVDEWRHGQPVEPNSSGYVRCGVQCYNGRRYLCKTEVFAVHRLIWKLETGNDPEGVIDHIDGVRHHNRFPNLRDVPQAENARNIHIGLWRGMQAEKIAAEKAKKQAAREAKEARRYARYLKMKAEYEG